MPDVERLQVSTQLLLKSIELKMSEALSNNALDSNKQAFLYQFPDLLAVVTKCVMLKDNIGLMQIDF